MLETRRKEIRRKAYEVRERCNISRYGIVDLFKECEKLGYKLLRYPLGEDKDLGFVMKKDDDIIIFTNTCSRLSREIFTLAHEIGHAVLHIKDKRPFIDNDFTISGNSMDDKEQEANYFASCLLMPEDEIDRFLDLEIGDFNINGLKTIDIARMMIEFNVSFEMTLNRLENLGKINSDQRIILDIERNSLSVGNLLRAVGGNSRLNKASEEIVIPYEYIDYAIYNYNHNVIPIETLKKTLAYYQLSIEDISDQLEEREEESDEDLDKLIGGIED